ncbi:MAG: HAD family hydrolase [Candidatus Coatesbacteria bacterium]|nr:MAG: HAD family hydrolase [Candidatus Coatesbacteria bacterium]
MSETAGLDKIEWVFIDVGGPIVDDGRWVAFLERALAARLRELGHDVTDEQVVGYRDEAEKLRVARPTVAVIARFVDDEAAAIEVFRSIYRDLKNAPDETYVELNAVRERAPEGLARLAERYKLATITNNINEVADLLDRVGVGRYFDFHWISEAAGCAKPAPEFFRGALERAGCEPEAALMVGDRLDNDIGPAKRLGMWAARVGGDHYTWQKPTDESEVPDVEAADLYELAEKLLNHS